MNITKKLSTLALLAALSLSATQSFATPLPLNVTLGDTVTSTGSVSEGATSVNRYFYYSFGPGVTAANFIFDFASTGANETVPLSVATNATLSNLLGGTTQEQQSLLWGTYYTFSLSGNALSGVVSVHLTANYDSPINSDSEYSLSVTAVPEPESYAMLLAGLGLMVSVARRRSHSA